MSKISKIRFKGYSEEVRRKLLKQLVKLDGRIGFRGYTKQDIVERSNGVLAYSPTNILNNKIVNGKNDTYISQAKYEESPEIMVKKNNILFVKTGSTLGKSSLVRELTEPATINPQLIVIKTIHVDSDYLAVYLLTDSIQKQIFQAKIGGAVPTLTETEIGKFVISLPSLAEQSAIGSLFRTLDELLASYKDNLANYQSLKTTMLSKMFPKAGKTVPEIRLDGFEGEWEIKRADEIFKSVSEKNKASLPVLSASQIDGMVLRDELGIDIKYDEATLNNYKVVKPGQFVIHLRSFQGGFALSKLEGITSPAYTIIDFIDKENSLPAFWNSILTSRDFIKRLETVTYGIRDGKSISFKDFSSLKFVFPEFKEQQAIGSYFSNLNNLMNSHQEKISQLETLKKKLLQDMFI